MIGGHYYYYGWNRASMHIGWAFREWGEEGAGIFMRKVACSSPIRAHFFFCSSRGFRTGFLFLHGDFMSFHGTSCFFHGFSWGFHGFHVFSWIFMRFSWFHGFSWWVFMDFHDGFSWIFIWLLLISMDFHWFSWVFMDFHDGNTFWTVLDHLDHQSLKKIPKYSLSSIKTKIWPFFISMVSSSIYWSISWIHWSMGATMRKMIQNHIKSISPMKIHENPWKHMKTHENPWKHMEIHENIWKYAFHQYMFTNIVQIRKRGEKEQNTLASLFGWDTAHNNTYLCGNETQMFQRETSQTKNTKTNCTTNPSKPPVTICNPCTLWGCILISYISDWLKTVTVNTSI